MEREYKYEYERECDESVTVAEGGVEEGSGESWSSCSPNSATWHGPIHIDVCTTIRSLAGHLHADSSFHHRCDGMEWNAGVMDSLRLSVSASLSVSVSVSLKAMARQRQRNDNGNDG